MVTKFDEITEKLGWFKPFSSVALWYKEKDAYTYKAVFDINRTYDLLKEHLNLDEEYVKGSLNFFPVSVFSKKSKNWCLPLLASDYFAHRQDFENELIWARKAIKENDKLTQLQFSKQIRDLL